MMIGAPLLISILPGLILISFAWWFKKMKLPTLIRLGPGVLGIIAAVILFYIGYVEIRGFEGAAYGISSFFLIIFAGIALVISRNPVNASERTQ